MASKWTTAFLLLALTVVVGAAGAAAMSASYEDSRQTLNASDPSSDGLRILDMGRDVQASTASLLPLFGFVAVPLGIVGLLGLGLVRRGSAGSRGRGRIR
jgi:hypothetical protein